MKFSVSFSRRFVVSMILQIYVLWVTFDSSRLSMTNTELLLSVLRFLNLARITFFSVVMFVVPRARHQTAWKIFAFRQQGSNGILRNKIVASPQSASAIQKGVVYDCNCGEFPSIDRISSPHYASAPASVASIKSNFRFCTAEHHPVVSRRSCQTLFSVFVSYQKFLFDSNTIQHRMVLFF